MSGTKRPHCPLLRTRPALVPAALSVLFAPFALAAQPEQAAAQAACCHDVALAIADEYRVAGLDDRRFDHDEYWEALEAALSFGSPDASSTSSEAPTERVRVTKLGESIEGRAINAVTLGSGPTTVLMWSQMHGAESTASMALADIIHWFAASPEDDGLRRTLDEQLTITMIPMLNPDGAERFIRHNAVGVDINRDARRLATPEARILKVLRDSIDADWGYNLHDQDSRTAGEGGKLVAISLLAPSTNEERTWGPVRTRARHLSAVIAEALTPEIAGRMSRYDDSFYPRAFGDNMQRWGTSTVLIESGALPDDPQKQELRRLNVLAILTSLHAIALGSYEDMPTAAYDDLPRNHSPGSDVLLTGGRVVMGDGEPIRLDVALMYDDAVAKTGARYGEIGDLSGAAALDTVDISGMFIHADPGEDGIIRRGELADLVVRRGEEPDSEVVWRPGAEGSAED